MVAFSGSDPIGVLIGAKRATATLIHKIAVHPDHCRQGHGRHLLESLSSKLAILGPSRIVAEVPEALAGACELFKTSGYAREAVLTDYVWDAAACPERGYGRAPRGDNRVEGFVIPVTVDDLAANGLFAESTEQPCWERSVETVIARKNEIAGLAFASHEQIDAHILYLRHEDGVAELMSLGSSIDDGGECLTQLLSQVRAAGTQTLRFPKVHATEIAASLLHTLAFRAVSAHVRYATRANPA
jgi:hypothetical protein